MRASSITLGLVVTLALVTSGAPAAAPTVAAIASPKLESIGPLTFNTDGVLFAADPQAATIYALELGAAGQSVAPGTRPVASLDTQLAALLGTTAAQLSVMDLAVHPKTRNAFVAVMRGQGADARPALVRIDGAGALTLVDLAALKASSVTLPNAPSATPGADRRAPQRAQSITDMAFADGRLYVAGLSNEEFSSKLRSIRFPFETVDSGTSVEIFHGNHGQLETRSPVFTFVPYTVGGAPHLIAGYLCTPLVKFPVASLQPGAKVLGTTIAELGNRNRPLDMVLYKKDGKEFLLMSNNSRGVMKIATDRFATEPAITARVTTETGGVPAEAITSMTGIEQLDLLNDTHSLVIARSDAGLSLDAVLLP